MKLKKSKAGLFLMVLYYAVFGVGIFFLMMLIMLEVGILAGLAAGFVLGIICGVIGGELEFIEHMKMLRKKRAGKKREEPSDEARIIAFPGNYSDSSSS